MESRNKYTRTINIGGIQIPISQKVLLSLTPARSGGVIASHSLDGFVDILSNLKNKPKAIVRVRIKDFFGRAKEILIHEDWIQMGDRIFKAAKKT